MDPDSGEYKRKKKLKTLQKENVVFYMCYQCVENLESVATVIHVCVLVFECFPCVYVGLCVLVAMAYAVDV